ncbi:choice-of-anchor D domain-containing protein, partial [Myxococcota bacterium]|nr:choice-of-anchor D domain-containing protein [Myxococcota bacterium]
MTTRPAARAPGAGRALLAAAVLALAPGCGCDDGGGEDLDGFLVVKPAVLDLGHVDVGLARRSELVLSNLGNAVLDLRSARAVAPLDLEVRLDAVPAALGPLEDATISVVFTPRLRGPRQGQITFVTDSRRTPEVSVPAVGLAVDPLLVATPPSLDFGRVVVGRTATATVVVTNLGADPVEIDAVTPDLGTSAELAAVLGGAEVLAPGASLSFVASYAPIDAGLDEGFLYVSDHTASPVRLAIFARGEGVWSELAVEPLEVAFTGVFVGDVRTRTVELRNVGAGVHTITSIALTSDTAELTLSGAATPIELQPGAAHTVTIRYAPVDALDDDAVLVLASTAFDGPTYVPVSGRAFEAPAPRLVITPEVVALGRVPVD